MASFTKITANNKQGYKWICTMDGPPDPVTGKRNQISRRADSKKEAEQRAEDAVNKLNRGLDLRKAKKISFEDASWEWLDTYSKSGVKASSVRVRKYSIKLLLKFLSQMNIDSVSHGQYQKILNTLFEKEYSLSSIKSAHIAANMIFDWAMKNNIRHDNPCTGVITPRRQLTVEEIERDTIVEKYLERNELEEFLAAVRKRGLYSDLEYFYLLTFSGIRPGELCALKWTDIDFKTCKVRITKTIYNPESNMYNFEITPPKTPGSIRTFDLDESVIEMLRSYKVNQDSRIKRYKKDYTDYYDGNFVFGRDNGRPINQKVLLDRMNRLQKRTRINKKATPHIFRHTHISMLAEAGVDLKTIMERVGHDDAKTTLKVYTHVTDTMKKNATEKVKIHFGNILNPE